MYAKLQYTDKNVVVGKAIILLFLNYQQTFTVSKQLLDEVFVISRIIQVEVRVIS